MGTGPVKLTWIRNGRAAADVVDARITAGHESHTTVFRPTQPARVDETHRIVADVAVQVKRLRIIEVTEKDAGWIRRHELTQAGTIITRERVIVACLRVAFVAGEFVGYTVPAGDLFSKRQIIHRIDDVIVHSVHYAG